MYLYASVVDVYEENEGDADEESEEMPSRSHQLNLSLEELLQLNQLYDACMTQNNSLIDGTASSSFPFSLSEIAPAELLRKTLRTYPDVDVFVLNSGSRRQRVLPGRRGVHQVYVFLSVDTQSYTRWRTNEVLCDFGL